jgi:predicted membrane chloride channel (bestrophin family)
VLFTWILGQLYVFTFAAGQALVNPFENRPSDTPISTIVRGIEINLLDVLAEKHNLPALPTVEGTHKM